MGNIQRVSLSAERRVILIFAMSALLSIVLVGGGLRYALQRMALAQCRTSLESLTGVLARQCDSEIAETRQDIEFLAKTPAFQQLPYVDRIDRSLNGIPENVEVEKRQILAQLMNKTERFSVLYVLPPNGDLYLVHPFRTQLVLKKYTLSDRPYYQEAVRTGKTVVSDSFVGADGILAVAILVPILAESGEVTGYLGGVFYLSRLSQLVAKEKIKPFDAGFIVDRQGYLIAHTNTDLLRENVRERFKDHPLVRGFRSMEGGTSAEERGTVFLDDCVDPADAKHYLAAFVPLRSGWGLGLMRDRTLVIAEIRPVIWWITCFSGLLLAVISGLAVVIAQRIGRNWHSTERALYAREAALKTSEERFRTAAESLMDVVYDWDIKEKVDWYGDIDGIMGYPPGEFPRTLEGWAATVHPEDKERVMAALEGHLKGMAPYVVEYRVGRRDGEWLWWSVRGTALRDDLGEPYKMIGSITDITDRKRAEEALREAEQRYRTLAESLPQLVWTCTPDGPCDYLSPQWVEYTGIPAAEQLGYSWTKQVHPDDLPRMQASWMQSVKTGGPFDIEFRIRRYDGAFRSFRTRAAPMRDPGGQIVKWIGLNLDVDDTKRAEEALRESERRFRSLVVATSQIIWSTDGQGQVSGPMPSFQAYTGQSDEEVKGSGWASALHPEDVERTIRVWASAVEDRTGYETEYRLRGSDGVYRHFSARGAPVITDDGVIREWIGACTDINERKRAEMQLLTQSRIADVFLTLPDDEMYNEVLKVILDVMQSPFGVFGYIDEDGALVVPSMTRNIWDKCQVPDKTFVFPRATWGCASWPRAIREKTPNYTNEPSANTPEGHIDIRRHISFPIMLQGEAIGLLQVANRETDYSEADIRSLEAIAGHIAPVLDARLKREQQEAARRRALVDLERSNSELEQFAYVASHDLQEPLRMVSSYTQLLEERYAGQLDEKAKKYMDYAVDGAVRMQRLINDLLAYSRVGTRGNPIENTDAHSVLGEAIRNLAATIEESKALITNEDLPMVRADASQLVQVFQNLLANAIKFRGEDSPRVHVSVRDDGRDWVFSVKDNGIGIDPQYADRVFVIFQRLHTRQEYPGTGIGLAVCKRIAERHGGKIWFESEPGKGSTFFFTIPK